MRYIQKICLALAFGLLIIAVLGLILVGDRFVAALFDVWKFSGFQQQHGIDLGANSSFQFLFICLLALSICMPLAIFAKRQNDQWLYRLVVAANVIYFINGLLLFLLVSSGLAFLYCGR